MKLVDTLGAFVLLALLPCRAQTAPGADGAQPPAPPTSPAAGEKALSLPSRPQTIHDVNVKSIITGTGSGLLSPSQAERAAAAAEARATFRVPPKEPWLALVQKLRKGASPQEVKAELPPSAKGASISEFSGGRHEIYQLDEVWTLHVVFTPVRDPKGKTAWSRLYYLREARLYESIPHYDVPPPEHFTGTWITYYRNGQKAAEAEYKDGQLLGPKKEFHTDGTLLSGYETK